MTRAEVVNAVLITLSALVIPTLVFLVRAVVKWTRTEDKLSELVNDVRELVIQGQADRAATDRRLRYIEEWFMNGRGRRAR